MAHLTVCIFYMICAWLQLWINSSCKFIELEIMVFPILQELPDGKWFCSMECGRNASMLENHLVPVVEKLPESFVMVVQKKNMQNASDSGMDWNVNWSLLCGKIAWRLRMLSWSWLNEHVKSCSNLGTWTLGYPGNADKGNTAHDTYVMSGYLVLGRFSWVPGLFKNLNLYYYKLCFFGQMAVDSNAFVLTFFLVLRNTLCNY